MASVISFVDLLQPLAAPVPLTPSSGGTRKEGQAQGPASTPAPPELGAGGVSAEAEAARTLAQARAEAAEVIADAETQAEALREAAWQEGRFQGEQAGRAAAEAKIQAEGEAQRISLRAQWDAMIDDIAEARQVLWQTQEQEMLALTLAIARQVIKAEVTQNPDVVRQVIANAVRRVVDKEMVRIRVCTGEAGRVREMRQDLIETLDGLHHLEIIDDRRISAGGCVIETNSGTIDAKIETQLGEIARALNLAEDSDE